MTSGITKQSPIGHGQFIDFTFYILLLLIDIGNHLKKKKET